MGKPMMLQERDHWRLESLKKRLKASSKQKCYGKRLERLSGNGAS